MITTIFRHCWTKNRLLLGILIGLTPLIVEASTLIESLSTCGKGAGSDIIGLCEPVITQPISFAQADIPLPANYQSADRKEVTSVRTDNILEIVDIQGDRFSDLNQTTYPFFKSRTQVAWPIIAEVQKRLVEALKIKGIELVPSPLAFDAVDAGPVKDGEQGEILLRATFSATTRKGTPLRGAYAVRVKTQDIQFQISFREAFDEEGNKIETPKPAKGRALRIVAYPEGSAKFTNSKTDVVLVELSEMKFGLAYTFLTQFDPK